MDPDRMFSDWLRLQMEEYWKTAEQLSDDLGGTLSETTIEKLRYRNIKWSSIPKNIKDEIVPKLEKILGPLPAEQISSTSFRPTNLAPPPTTFTDEKINELLYFPEPEDGDYSDENEPPSSAEVTQAELVLIDAPREEETIPSGSHSGYNIPESKSCWFASCSRCTEPITDDTKPCPHCGKRSDWSQ